VPFANLASGKVWWEELTRATLGSPALTLATSTFTARKYIQLRIIVKQSGAAISPWIRFNGDTGNNYSLRYSANYSAGTALGSQNGFSINPGTLQTDVLSVADIYNEVSKEKQAYIVATDLSTAGAANVPNIITSNAKWANTANQITSISLFESGTANNFGTGTEIVVLGHD